MIIISLFNPGASNSNVFKGHNVKKMQPNGLSVRGTYFRKPVIFGCFLFLSRQGPNKLWWQAEWGPENAYLRPLSVLTQFNYCKLVVMEPFTKSSTSIALLTLGGCGREIRFNKWNSNSNWNCLNCTYSLSKKALQKEQLNKRKNKPNEKIIIKMLTLNIKVLFDEL